MPSPYERAAFWWACEVAKVYPAQATAFYYALAWRLDAQRVQTFGCNTYIPSEVLAEAAADAGVRWGRRRVGDRESAFPFPWFTMTTFHDDGRVTIASGSGGAAVWEVP